MKANPPTKIGPLISFLDAGRVLLDDGHTRLMAAHLEKVFPQTTHRFMIASAPSRRITPAAIFVVGLSSGPYVATVPMGHCGCCRPERRARSSSTPLP